MNDFLPSDQLVAHRAQLDTLQQEAVTLTGELSTAQAQYDDIIANAAQQTGEEEETGRQDELSSDELSSLAARGSRRDTTTQQWIFINPKCTLQHELS